MEGLRLSDDLEMGPNWDEECDLPGEVTEGGFNLVDHFDGDHKLPAEYEAALTDESEDAIGNLCEISRELEEARAVFAAELRAQMAEYNAGARTHWRYARKPRMNGKLRAFAARVEARIAKLEKRLSENEDLAIDHVRGTRDLQHTDKSGHVSTANTFTTIHRGKPQLASTLRQQSKALQLGRGFGDILAPRRDSKSSDTKAYGIERNRTLQVAVARARELLFLLNRPKALIQLLGEVDQTFPGLSEELLNQLHPDYPSSTTPIMVKHQNETKFLNLLQLALQQSGYKFNGRMSPDGTIDIINEDGNDVGQLRVVETKYEPQEEKNARGKKKKNTKNRGVLLSYSDDDLNEIMGAARWTLGVLNSDTDLLVRCAKIVAEDDDFDGDSEGREKLTALLQDKRPGIGKLGKRLTKAFSIDAAVFSAICDARQTYDRLRSGSRRKRIRRAARISDEKGRRMEKKIHKTEKPIKNYPPRRKKQKGTPRPRTEALELNHQQIRQARKAAQRKLRNAQELEAMTEENRKTKLATEKVLLRIEEKLSKKKTMPQKNADRRRKAENRKKKSKHRALRKRSRGLRGRQLGR